VTMVSMLYVIWHIDRALALISLLLGPMLFLTANLYRRPLRQLSREAKHRESVTMSVVHEVLSGLRVVKAFGREEHEKWRFMRRSREGLGARLRLVIARGSLEMLTTATMVIGHGAVLYVGVVHVQSGVITLGSLLLVLGYLQNLFTPLQTLGKQVANLQSFLASAERAFAILDEEPEAPEHPQARPLVRSGGVFAFRDVSFEYGPERPVLHEITFDAAAGQRVGIVGRTGAGKSTLMSLLVRFYDPTRGQILLDGVDLRQYKLADLRNQYAIVFQEPILFSTTIAENIAYGRSGATEDEIIAAARAANAHDFIAALPQGYETPVGERGQCLSGGERQRVALARAFLKDAPILILDEPTSAVDIDTETLIIDAMDRLMQGRTTFMIAHRLDTLKKCHCMLVMENGRLVSVEQDVVAAIERGAAAGTLEAVVGK
jgi:ATP-binding cassette subfamily B protein